MGIYFIGKTQKDIESIKNLSGSHTIFGENFENNFSCYSKNDENKPLSSKKKQLAYQDLRYGMETFKFLDKDARFIFDDEDTLSQVMKIKNDNFVVTNDEITLIKK